MDCIEEQKSEIEALESIYYGDVSILSSEPFYKFLIPIKSEEYESTTNNGLACNLVFTYTAKYPNEAPIIEIEEPENFQGNNAAELLNCLQEEVDANIGMVMIFTLVSAAQEWLNVKWDEIKKERDEASTRKQKEDEEEERKRFEGTCVTVETFLKWKTAFEDDMGIAKKRQFIDREGKKLTGRDLFLTDKSLNESDLKFLEDGEAVKVDESLFQELDDLDLDDDDDEDFDPNNCNSSEDSS